MAKTLSLKGELREDTGSKHSAAVRLSGRIPAIVYGHKRAPMAISLEAHALTEVLHHGHRLIDVVIGKARQKVLVKDLQYDHLGKNIIHADLIRVDITEMVKVSVPIELKGTAAGTKEGGIINEHADHLEIECKVTEIPETITVSVRDVGLGGSIHASELELPEGVKLLSDPDTVIVTCSIVAAAKSTEQLEEEIPAAPEVIGEEAPEDASGQEQER